MQSAVIIAEKAAAEAAAPAATIVNGNDSAADPLASSTSTSAVITTPGAIVKDGQVYLRGNPLKTTPEILCPSCKLPRLLHPTTGSGSQPIPDPSKEYCAKRPFISKPGHDIHGNPFATDKPVAKTTKPPRKIGNGKLSETKQTPPSSSDTLTASPPDADQDNPSIPPEQQQEQVAPITFPNVKCPNCSRYLIVTRIAQHLDKCLGISGRQSSRNALKRLTETPRDSRAGTPSAGLGKRNYAEEDTDEDDAPKKKKKRVLKKKVGTKPAAAAKTTKKAAATKKPAAGKTTKKSTGKGKLRDEDVDKGVETGSLKRSHDSLERGDGEYVEKDRRKDSSEAAGKKARKTYGGKH